MLERSPFPGGVANGKGDHGVPSHPRSRQDQLLFREVNERLRETVGPFEGPIEFLCECSNDACIDTILLTLEEYERIRSHANLFLVAHGHELIEVERVVDQSTGYLLVEKTVAADAVIKADPRTRDA